MSVRSSDGNTDFSAWDPSEVPFDAEREAREQLAIAKASWAASRAARTIRQAQLVPDQSLKKDRGKLPMDLLPGEVLTYLRFHVTSLPLQSPEVYIFRFMEPGGPDRHNLADAIVAMLDSLDVSWWEGMEGVAQVLGFGASKYRRHGWRDGMEWSRLIGAALRHLSAHQLGKLVDEESGLPHAWHFLCCVVFLLSYHLTGKGTDDRYRYKTVAVDDA